MMPPSNMTCHDTGHKKKCKDLCMNCWKWVQIQGHNPNTGAQESEWKCSDHWMVFLTIENSQQQRETGAAVESFRNEMVEGNRQFIGMLKQAAQNKITEHSSESEG